MKQFQSRSRDERPLASSSVIGKFCTFGATAQTGVPWINVVEGESSAWIKRAEFSGTGAPAIRKLSEMGVHVIGGQRVRALLERVSAIREFPERMFIEGPGWNGEHFALPDGSVFSPTGSSVPEVLFQADATKCASSGTLEGWQTAVAAPLARHPIPAFFIMAAFAPPLLAFLPRAENFGFELIGPGGIGKTTIQKLMASALGPPRTSPLGYPIAMDATRVGLAAEMRRHADLPLILDEAMSFAPGESTRVRGVKLRELAMKLGLGQETRKDGRPDPGSYRFVFVISTNEGMRDLTIGESAAQNEAASDRLIPLYLEGRRFGVFNRKPKGFKGTRSFARTIERAAIEHHGTAIRHFLSRLVQHRQNNSEELSAGLSRRVDEFCKWAEVDPNDGSKGRVAEAFAIVMAAGLLARFYGVLPREFDCEGAARACYRLHIRDRRSKSTFVDELHQIARSRDVIHLNGKSLPNFSIKELEKAGVFLNVNRRKVVEVLFWPGYFQRRYPNFQRLIREPEVAALMICEGDRPTAKRMVRAGYPNDRFYCFALG